MGLDHKGEAMDHVKRVIKYISLFVVLLLLHACHGRQLRREVDDSEEHSPHSDIVGVL